MIDVNTRRCGRHVEHVDHNVWDGWADYRNGSYLEEIVWMTPRSSERFKCDVCRWKGSDKVQFRILIMYWIRAVTLNGLDKWLMSCSGIKYLPAAGDPLSQNVPVMQFLSIKRGCIVECRSSQPFLGCERFPGYVCALDVNFCDSASTQSFHPINILRRNQRPRECDHTLYHTINQ